MLAKLLEQNTVANERHEVAVTKEEFLIGRGVDCDLRLGGSAISRHHCLLRIRGGEATLSDLGSANGTFVNGQRIRSQTTLINGDILDLGDQHFMLELHGGSGIDWGAETGVNRDMPTLRGIKPKKEESHPPGEAGG